MKNILFNSLLLTLGVYIVFIAGEFYFFSLSFVIMQIIAILLIFWAIIIRRLQRHQAIKHAENDIYWIKNGPYEFIRFPVYSGILLMTLAYVQSFLTIQKGIAFLLFVLVLIIKLRREEKLNRIHFGHGYTDYEKKAKRLIPYLY